MFPRFGERSVILCILLHMPRVACASAAMRLP